MTLFITLGRIFDVDTKAFSVDDLLKCCIKEINIFSSENLRIRKMVDQNGNEPAWLSKYIEDAYEPIENDFSKLRGEVSKRRNIFENVYRPIRHKIIAHKDKNFLDNANDLWVETNIVELEEIIWFLNDLKVTLSETFLNGKKPELRNRKPDIAFYERDFGRLLDNVKKL